MGFIRRYQSFLCSFLLREISRTSYFIPSSSSVTPALYLRAAWKGKVSESPVRNCVIQKETNGCPVH